ncbi:hypothetical protein TNCV_4343571 [Trichonephila clavipes]|nr:hypothetical protein TNCV_4343571 [Trichonephila clavipes]
MTPRDVFKDLCGIIFTGESRNVLASRKAFVCVEEMVSTSRSPDRNLSTDFGSPPIPFRALCIANGDLRDMALLGKEISKNLTRLAVSSIARLGNTRPLPWHSRLGSVSVEKKLHSGVPPPTTESNKGGSVPVIWQKTRHGAYLEYIQNIMLQHQGEDPTGNPTPLICNTNPTAVSLRGHRREVPPAD